jgi:predicted nuclease with TOPRIM domain
MAPATMTSVSNEQALLDLVAKHKFEELSGSRSPAETEASSDEVVALQAEITKLKHQAQEVGSELKASRDAEAKAADEIARLQAELLLKKRIEELPETPDLMEKEVLCMIPRVGAFFRHVFHPDAATTLEIEIKHLKADLESLKSVESKLAAAHQAEAKASAEIAHLKEELQEAKQFEALATGGTSVKAEMTKLKNQSQAYLDSLITLESELTSTREAEAKAALEVMRLKAELQEAKTSEAKLQQELEALKKEPKVRGSVRHVVTRASTGLSTTVDMHQGSFVLPVKEGASVSIAAPPLSHFEVPHPTIFLPATDTIHEAPHATYIMPPTDTVHSVLPDHSFPQANLNIPDVHSAAWDHHFGVSSQSMNFKPPTWHPEFKFFG